MIEKLHEVFKYEKGPINSETEKKIENINRLKEETKKSANKRYRKLWIGEVDFSPTLKNLRKTWE